MPLKKHRYSNHALQRFKERFGHHIIEMPLVAAFNKAFRQSHESKQHINDTCFMVEQYEKYGYEKEIKVRIYQDVVFICKDRTVITVYNVKGRNRAHQKHGKRKKVA